jgi:hypothetical protein
MDLKQSLQKGRHVDSGVRFEVLVRASHLILGYLFEVVRGHIISSMS